MNTSKLLACINASILLWTLLAIYTFRSAPVFHPAPVYGWKELSRQAVPFSLPVLARAALSQPEKGQRLRFAIETEDAGGSLALTTSAWACVANCER